MKRLPAFILFLIISLFFISPPRVSAQIGKCNNFQTNPYPVTTADKFIGVSFKTPGLKNDEEYRLKLNERKLKGYNINNPIDPSLFKVSDNEIRIENLTEDGSVFSSKEPFLTRLPDNFKSTFYILTVFSEDEKTSYCSFSFMVERPKSTKCSIDFSMNESFMVIDDILIKVDGLSGDDTTPHQIMLKRKSGAGPYVNDWWNNEGELKKGINIGKHEAGVYFVQIHDFAYLSRGGDVLCNATFEIVPAGKLGGGLISTGSGDLKKYLPPVCEPQGGKQVSFICKTAIGDIDTNPTAFIKRIFGFILSLSGGIALLLIIFSGYKFMTSQGNPEKIQGARETIMSAIIGLLFIILSMLILQVIGVDILRIPGFG